MTSQDAMRLHATLMRSPMLAALLNGFGRIGLPDCWLVAGCVTQTVWNLTAGRDPQAGIRDIDLIYCDPTDLSAGAEAAHEARLRALLAPLPCKLDVKNQARVHLWYSARFGREIAPHATSAAAIAGYPTTATALGVRVHQGRFELCAPFGLADLFAGIVRPNKALVSRAVYEAKATRWQACWPALRIIPWDDPDQALA